MNQLARISIPQVGTAVDPWLAIPCSQIDKMSRVGGNFSCLCSSMSCLTAEGAVAVIIDKQIVWQPLNRSWNFFSHPPNQRLFAVAFLRFTTASAKTQQQDPATAMWLPLVAGSSSGLQDELVPSGSLRRQNCCAQKGSNGTWPKKCSRSES